MSNDTSDRMALVGAASLLGREIKDRLAEAGFPGRTVELLDLDEEVGLLTDYGSEARVVSEAGEASIRGHRVVCFCGDAETTRRFAPLALADGAIVVDALAVLDERSRLWGATDDEEIRLLRIPHGGTALLAALAGALDLEDAVVTLLLPASELDDSGPEELARQSVALLSFDAEEQGGVFGRRQAFDMWADAGADGGPAERIRGELATLALPVARLTTVRVPIFHSIAATVFVPRLTAEQTVAQLLAAEVQIDSESRGELIDSPARVAGHPGLRITDIRPDPQGGTWLWALADNYLTASTAVLEIAATHLDPADQSIN